MTGSSSSWYENVLRFHRKWFLRSVRPRYQAAVGRATRPVLESIFTEHSRTLALDEPVGRGDRHRSQQGLFEGPLALQIISTGDLHQHSCPVSFCPLSTNKCLCGWHFAISTSTMPLSNRRAYARS